MSKNGKHINIGRRKVALTKPTPAQVQRARSELAVRHNDAYQKEKAELKAENARLEIRNREDNLEWTAITRAKAAGLDEKGPETRRLVHEVLLDSRRARKEGKVGNPYGVIQKFLAELPGSKSLAPASTMTGNLQAPTQTQLAPLTKEELAKLSADELR